MLGNGREGTLIDPNPARVAKMRLAGEIDGHGLLRRTGPLNDLLLLWVKRASVNRDFLPNWRNGNLGRRVQNSRFFAAAKFEVMRAEWRAYTFAQRQRAPARLSA